MADLFDWPRTETTDSPMPPCAGLNVYLRGYGVVTYRVAYADRKRLHVELVRRMPSCRKCLLR